MKFTDTEIAVNKKVKERVIKEIKRIVWKEKQMTLAEFCELVKYPRTNFYPLQKNETYKVPLSFIYLLVTKFEVDANYLFTGKR